MMPFVIQNQMNAVHNACAMRGWIGLGWGEEQSTAASTTRQCRCRCKITRVPAQPKVAVEVAPGECILWLCALASGGSTTAASFGGCCVWSHVWSRRDFSALLFCALFSTAVSIGLRLMSVNATRFFAGETAGFDSEVFRLTELFGTGKLGIAGRPALLLLVSASLARGGAGVRSTVAEVNDLSSSGMFRTPPGRAPAGAAVVAGVLAEDLAPPAGRRRGTELASLRGRLAGSCCSRGVENLVAAAGAVGVRLTTGSAHGCCAGC